MPSAYKKQRNIQRVIPCVYQPDRTPKRFGLDSAVGFTENFLRGIYVSFTQVKTNLTAVYHTGTVLRIH
jgi:hypothetical protein